MSGTVIHLRAECKPLEYRSALTPSTAKALIDAGYTLYVERSPERIFEDEEFEKAGVKLVPEGSWVDAPRDHIILGLKELPEESFPLSHTHVQFAHCYKEQAGWESILSRFPRGHGTLLDLEFLTDENGRRVAAFGYHAGFAGAALALQAWAWQITHPSSETFPGVKPYDNEDLLLRDVRASVERAMAQPREDDKHPKVLVIGALGRCGTGAVELCQRVGIPEDRIVKWDLPDTARGGPFDEITDDSDIFVNCIYLSSAIPPFVSPSKVRTSTTRKLSVVCDVSCDTTNPHNPVPIYDRNTTFEHPLLQVPVDHPPKLAVISIDHLPSLLPREASEAFSRALLPSLLQLKDRQSARVWKQAGDLFKEKVETLSTESRSS